MKTNAPAKPSTQFFSKGSFPASAFGKEAYVQGKFKKAYELLPYVDNDTQDDSGASEVAEAARYTLKCQVLIKNSGIERKKAVSPTSSSMSKEEADLIEEITNIFGVPNPNKS